MDRVFGTHDTPPRPTPRARARRESRRKAAQTRTTTLGRPFWKRVCKTLVPAVGLEPTRGCPREILNLLRLPTSPRRQRERHYTWAPRQVNRGPDFAPSSR